MLEKSSYTHVKYSQQVKGAAYPHFPFPISHFAFLQLLGNEKSGQVRFLYPTARWQCFIFLRSTSRLSDTYVWVVCQRISIPPKTFASLLAPCFWFYRHRLQHFGERTTHWQPRHVYIASPDGPMYCQTGALSKHLCSPAQETPRREPSNQRTQLPRCVFQGATTVAAAPCEESLSGS